MGGKDRRRFLSPSDSALAGKSNAACSFGVRIVAAAVTRRRHLLRFLDGRQIKKLGPADTTPVMVAYAASLATWKALGMVPESPPELDQERNGFFFPR